MTDTAIQNEQVEDAALAPPPDEENPALIDARKTYKITVISAVVFCLAALVIILSTRLGS